MDWKTFFSNIVTAIAWPATAVFVIWLFKDAIVSILPSISKIKHKETEIEFAKKVEELKQESDPTLDVNLLTRGGKQEFQFLMRLAEISPRSAVLESWRKLESAAASVIARIYPELDKMKIAPTVQLGSLLERKGIMSPKEAKEFEELRRLKNNAAHAVDFDLQGRPIESYLDIAMTMTERLRQK